MKSETICAVGENEWCLIDSSKLRTLVGLELEKRECTLGELEESLCIAKGEVWKIINPTEDKVKVSPLITALLVSSLGDKSFVLYGDFSKVGHVATYLLKPKSPPETPTIQPVSIQEKFMKLFEWLGVEGSWEIAKEECSAFELECLLPFTDNESLHSICEISGGNYFSVTAAIGRSNMKFILRPKRKKKTSLLCWMEDVGGLEKALIIARECNCTPYEMQILDLYFKKMKPKEIANHLKKTTNTIYFKLQKIKKKLLK